MVIVTKCPEDIKPIDFNIIAKHLDLYPFQDLFFSSLSYGQLTPVFPSSPLAERKLSSLKKEEEVLLVTGIASPTHLKKTGGSYVYSLLTFNDHHNFSKEDIKRIKQQFERLPGERKPHYHEKDAIRLKHLPGIPG